jgi:hypothetical protein
MHIHIDAKNHKSHGKQQKQYPKTMGHATKPFAECLVLTASFSLQYHTIQALI